MVKRFLLLLMLTALTISPAFSGGKSESESDSPAKPAAKPQFIQIKSSSIGGTWYAGGAAWAKLITDNTNYIATNSSSPGLDNETIRRITEGKAVLGFVGGAGAYIASQGGGTWEKPQEINGLFTIWSNAVCVVVHDESRFKTVADLKGASIGTYVEGDVNGDQVLEMLKFHGVDESNSKFYRIMKADATRMFVDKTVDALIYQYSPGHADLRQIVASRKIRFLPPVKDSFDKFVKENPFYYLGEFGVEFGVKPELQPIISAFTTCHANADPEMIYQFVKVWFENLDWLTTVLPSSIPNVNTKDPAAGIPVNIHPGAMKYYKEAGIYK